MFCCPKTCSELKKLNRLTINSLLLNSTDSIFVLVDLIMLGTFGKGQLAAGAIGYSIYNIGWLFIEGFLTAQDTLMIKSKVMKENSIARYWSYISFLLIIFIGLVSAIVFLVVGLIIIFGYNLKFHTSSRAIIHLFLLLPGLLFHSFYRIIQKLLQSNGYYAPSFIVNVVGIVTNLLGNFLLMNVFGMGFYGCGTASSISRFIMFIALLQLLKRKEDISLNLRELQHLAEISSKQTDGRSFSTQLLDAARSEWDNNTESFPKNRENEKINNPILDEDISLESKGDIEMTVYNGNKKLNRRRDQNVKLSRNAEDTKETKKIKDIEENGKEHDSDEFSEEEIDFQEAPLIHGKNQIKPSSPLLKIKNANTVRKNISRYLKIAIPGGLVLVLDSGVYELGIILIAPMGNVSVSAQQILVFITGFFYLAFPFSLSISASTRINYHLTKGNFKRASITAYLCMWEGFFSMLLAAGLVYISGSFTGYLFTADQDVIQRVKDLSPYVACFQIALGLQGSLQGVLRATSHQWDIVGFTVGALWVVGLLLALYLSFWSSSTFGLEGFWVGLTIGMSLLALTLFIQLVSLDWVKEGRKIALIQRKINGIFPDNIINNLKLEIEENENIEIKTDQQIAENNNEIKRRNKDIKLSWTQKKEKVLELSGLEVSLPVVGGRSLGGIPALRRYKNLREEMDELEEIEFGSVIQLAPGARFTDYEEEDESEL